MGETDVIDQQHDYQSAATSSVLLSLNWDIQILLVDGFGNGTMHSGFCYIASVNPSLTSNIIFSYGRSTFLIHNFPILIADSDSSQKSSYTNYFHFSKILMGTRSKLQKNNEFEGRFNLPSFSMVFVNFGCVPVRILIK